MAYLYPAKSSCPSVLGKMFKILPIRPRSCWEDKILPRSPRSWQILPVPDLLGQEVEPFAGFWLRTDWFSSGYNRHAIMHHTRARTHPYTLTPTLTHTDTCDLQGAVAGRHLWFLPPIPPVKDSQDATKFEMYGWIRSRSNLGSYNRNTARNAAYMYITARGG